MMESHTFHEDALHAIIDGETKRDRLARRVSIIAWSVTFLVLIGFGAVIGQQVARAWRLTRVGVLPHGAVVEGLVPLFVVVGTTSLLLALVSTAAVFLRQRTASLADIQLRLATLEAMIGGDREGENES